MSVAKTRDVVRGFYDTWTEGDPLAAREYLSDDFTYTSPNIDFDNPGDFIKSLGGFRRLCTGIDLISELYGEDEATLIYDAHTATPAGTMRSVDHFRLVNTKIASLMLIFDATEWRAFVDAGKSATPQ